MLISGSAHMSHVASDDCRVVSSATDRPVNFWTDMGLQRSIAQL